MESQYFVNEDRLHEFIRSSYQFFDDNDKYIFLGGLLKALGSEGVRIIQDSIQISTTQLFEAERKLNELREMAEVQ